ncbi:hypothetical protein MKC73_10995 [[Clostridium] innocuum]|nr:hypothetical protein [[Clostridium] innocuum]
MLYDILLLFRIRTTRKVNGFFYFFRRIPFLGGLLKEGCYAAVHLKTVLSVFSFLLDILINLLKNLLYLFVIIAVPLINLQKDASDEQISNGFLFGFVLLSLVAGAVCNSKLLIADEETFILSRQMRMEAKRCLQSRSWYSYGMNVAGLSLSTFLLSFMLSFSYWYALLAGCGYLGSHLLVDAIQMHRFAVHRCFYFKKNTYQLLIPLGSLLVLYLLYWLQLDMSFARSLFCVSALLCAMAIFPYLRYAHTYSCYSELLTRLLVENHEILKLNDMEMKQMEVAVDEKSFTSEELHLQTDKSGYAFLNELFFRRHKHLIYKPVRFRLAIMTILWVAGTIAIIVFQKDIKITKDILELLPPFVFLSYILSISQRVCKAMFMNCDVSLLHYSYYRRKEAVLENFRLRLKKLCFYNMMLLMVLCLYVNITVILCGLSYTLPTLLLFDFAVLCLAVFFSIHYLFVYYIFQPYNEQFDMKDPFMSILNGLVYLLCYLCMQIEGSLMFVSGVLAATIVYIALALVLVYRLAPKTFHLK